MAAATTCAPVCRRLVLLLLRRRRRGGSPRLPSAGKRLSSSSSSLSSGVVRTTDPSRKMRMTTCTSNMDIFYQPSASYQNHPSTEATIISGKKLAAQVCEEIRKDVDSWLALGNKRPHLTVVLVGDNPASHTYVRNKVKAAAAVGICSEIILRPKDISQEELLDLTGRLNKDPRVSGILVQLPLPGHIDERTVCNTVAPEKDVDGFHIFNIGQLCLDQPSVIPATAAAVWEIIKRTGIQTFGRNVVVVGRSKNVGMPISMLLHTDGGHERPGGDATVTIAHRYTPKDQLKIHTQLADIVIVAAEVKKKAAFITPVPGGVGPMTVAMLLKNTLIAAKKLIY
ncbi:bifunctional methylenetetrahydrofolate dehydrogenase/cyclohydrolase 2, mitochondrial isoform X4 [Podarcis raffonei]|uniref:bifunctional methylenetetrahydrofolate dehydrogenase/cyclohydrolase 2, mitochondrial isoform X4 n=1 Tax=Podarcis raffonei TaxID=65483 RepID=UPI0023292F93|nr:bifunctional methylenetetrahydrofolate dehydrogenase/cyclohydrolase 2, mitochondrial isoform X4 [Podarcis raffonei]